MPRLSRVAALFGPNGSGKTNLVEAFRTLRDLVLHSTAYTDEQYEAHYTPFESSASMAEPTEFEVDIIVNQVRYRYRVAYTAIEIRYERLVVYRSAKPQRWFERWVTSSSQATWAQFSSGFQGPREMWRRATRPKALFVSAALQLGAASLEPLVGWFQHCLEVSSDLGESRSASRIQDPSFKSRVLQLLHSVDIWAQDIRLVTTPAQLPEPPLRGAGRSSLARVGPPQIEFQYQREGAAPIWRGVGRESTGVLRLFKLLGALLEMVERDKFLVIDDFDMNLHPLISRFLFRLTTEPSRPHKGQLLVVTHDPSLMDLQLLRRDQIWLMNRDPSGASHLTDLTGTGARKNGNLCRAYLRGSYGALPVISGESSPAVRNEAPKRWPETEKIPTSPVRSMRSQPQNG